MENAHMYHQPRKSICINRFQSLQLSDVFCDGVEVDLSVKVVFEDQEYSITTQLISTSMNIPPGQKVFSRNTVTILAP